MIICNECGGEPQDESKFYGTRKVCKVCMIAKSTKWKQDHKAEHALHSLKVYEKKVNAIEKVCEKCGSSKKKKEFKRGATVCIECQEKNNARLLTKKATKKKKVVKKKKAVVKPIKEKVITMVQPKIKKAKTPRKRKEVMVYKAVTPNELTSRREKREVSKFHDKNMIEIRRKIAERYGNNVTI